MLLQSPGKWPDYELIDSGGFEKLERFGPWILRRPEPQAVWSKALEEKKWLNSAHVTFIQEGSSGGKWEKRDPQMPDQWVLRYPHKNYSLKFRLGLTGFKHVGIFPEQAPNWDFIFDQVRQIPGANVLNLFAYTGGASMAARAGGADVIHCDSIKQVVNWANENMELSGQQGIRWLVEDAFRFVKKEAARGKKYQGILLDPPAWGHGPKGEKWKLEEMINEMMENIAAILDKDNGFLLFNAYSLGFSPMILENLMLCHLGKDVQKELVTGELFLPDQAGRRLPAGVFCRYSRIKS